jgi:hypothetical protein
MDIVNEQETRQAELWLEHEPLSAPLWLRVGETLRDAWLTGWRGLPEEQYVARTFRRMAAGHLRETLGLEVRDEAETRGRSERWFAQLMALGLRPSDLCVEYGCGSLWCAEPFIQYLQPGRFIGLDVTDGFYALGRQRLGSLLDDKKVRLGVISRQSLREAAALGPNFVYSHRVLHHVPRYALARYMRNICSLLHEQTVLVMENVPRARGKSSIRTPRYTVTEFRRHLPLNWLCESHAFGFVITHRTGRRIIERR